MRAIVENPLTWIAGPTALWAVLLWIGSPVFAIAVLFAIVAIIVALVFRGAVHLAGEAPSLVHVIVAGGTIGAILIGVSAAKEGIGPLEAQFALVSCILIAVAARAVAVWSWRK